MNQDFQDDLLWVEKYRPQTVKDCILPARIKKSFLDIVKQGNMPNLILSGSAGTGKTTIARALCNDMNYEYILINASKDRNLALIDKIAQIASTISLEGKKKAIILDEADGLNPQNAQPALRASMEENSHIRFILTCNYKNRILEPIHSRASIVDFNLLATEKEEMRLTLLRRIIEILGKEGVTFDMKVVAEVVKKYHPDNRKILNTLQRYSAGKVIDAGLLETMNKASISVLIKAVRERDLGACRQWVTDNADVDTGSLFTDIYEAFYHEVLVTEDNPNNILDLIQLVADYQHKAVVAINPEINTMAMIAGLLKLEFKAA